MGLPKYPFFDPSHDSVASISRFLEEFNYYTFQSNNLQYNLVSLQAEKGIRNFMFFIVCIRLKLLLQIINAKILHGYILHKEVFLPFVKCTCVTFYYKNLKVLVCWSHLKQVKNFVA